MLDVIKNPSEDNLLENNWDLNFDIDEIVDIAKSKQEVIQGDNQIKLKNKNKSGPKK